MKKRNEKTQSFKNEDEESRFNWKIHLNLKKLQNRESLKG